MKWFVWIHATISSITRTRTQVLRHQDPMLLLSYDIDACGCLFWKWLSNCTQYLPSCWCLTAHGWGFFCNLNVLCVSPITWQRPLCCCLCNWEGLSPLSFHMSATSCLAGSWLLPSLRRPGVVMVGNRLTKAHTNTRATVTTEKIYAVNPIGASIVITTLIYWFWPNPLKSLSRNLPRSLLVLFRSALFWESACFL